MKTIQYKGSIYIKAVEKIAGTLSWKNVNELAKKHNGYLDKRYKSKSDAAQDTKWSFKSFDDRNEFIYELQQNHMTIKTESPGVIVWF